MRTFNSTHEMVPPVFRTACSCQFAGTLPAATPARSYFLVSGNSAHIPFASALVGSFNSVNTLSASGYASEVYNTTQPQGFSAICSNISMYLRYRVTASRIKFKFMPTSTADNMFAVVNTVTTGANPNTTVWTAAEAPNASKMQEYATTSPNPYVTKTCTTSHVWGVNEAGVRQELNYSGAYNTSPPFEWAWVINYQIVDNTVTNAIMGFIVSVEYDIEFFAPQTGGVPDTFSSTADVSHSSTTLDVIKALLSKRQ